MPVAPPGIIGVLVPNMIATGNIGTGVAQLATGIANGLVQWVPTVVVQTVDTGTLGVGKNVPTPIIVPQPLIYGNVLAGMASKGLLGIFAPLLALGIANGLVLAFLQMLINTTHAGVGVGAGVARFQAPPAEGAMIAGFKQAGMKGQATEMKALALAQALNLTFAVLVLPVVIAGPPSPLPGGGVGVGNII